MRIGTSISRLLVLISLSAAGTNILSAQPCQLNVTQPAGTPSVIRFGGNAVLGSVSLRLTSAASGNWLVYLTAHLNFRPQGGSTWTEVNYGTSATSISNGTAFGFTYSSGSVQTGLQPRGNGDYQITVTSYGVCGANTYPLTPTNPVPSNILPVARPTITTNGIQGVWWFGTIGMEDAANAYYTAAAIVGTPNWNGTLTYSISQGATKVQLSCTNCNTTAAQAREASGGCTQDVTITASADGFMAAAPVKLMVNRPAGRYPSSTYLNSAVPGGYWSKDYFTFTDLCSYSMSSVAYHERFSGSYKSYWPGVFSSYWSTPPQPAGWTAYRQDKWTTWDDIVSVCADAGCIPTSVSPSGLTTSRSGSASLMQQAIVALHQIWYVGNATAGAVIGWPAHQCNHTLYQDHAEDINYW